MGIKQKTRNSTHLNSLISGLVLTVSSTFVLADENTSETNEKNHYVQNRSYRTVPTGDIPRYVRSLSQTGMDGTESIDWLDVGLDHRVRYEYRDMDFRRPTQKGLDEAVLLRTRAYLGVKNILDPLRFVAEFQDSRSYNSQYIPDNRDVNEFDLIQLYGELYFKDALGSNRPVSIKGGRMWLEYLDRRLIANNEFRNTTNNFQGVRIKLGQQTNDWEVDFLALQPIERLKYTFDRPVEQEWLYGTIANWRGWSDIVTVQPYYLGYRHDSSTVKDA
ncbi:MAG: alginate export family protein, partial [Methylococcaceae bacterium]